MTGRSKVSLGERIKSLSILTKVVCVVIVVASVAAGVIAGFAAYEPVKRWLMPPTRHGPITTSPDGKWQARGGWEDYGEVHYGEPIIYGRIDAWPAGERGSSRTVFYAFDKMVEPTWVGGHTLKVMVLEDSDSYTRRINVAAEPDLEATPDYEWQARTISLSLMILTPLPALVAVVLIVAVKSRRPGSQSGASEDLLRS